LQSLSFNGDNQQTKLLLLQMLSYKQGSINDMVSEWWWLSYDGCYHISEV